MSQYVQQLVKKARAISYRMPSLDAATKNKALERMAKYLFREKDAILKANEKDLTCARSAKRNKSFIDRLALTDDRLKEMSACLREVAALPDPVGQVLRKWTRPNGLRMQKVSVPIGVILMIYEARPNVTSDSAGLMFKSSNVGILRGGKDAAASNKAIGKALQKGVVDSGIAFLPFFVVERSEHSVVNELLAANESIDMVIPRGGEALIRKVVESSKIPVIKHYKGVCHIFVDKDADLKKTLAICVNAKAQRPSVCNAVETILVHKAIAKRLLPKLKKEFDQQRVVMRGCKTTRTILKSIKAATNQDWTTEYLDLTVAVKVVGSVDEAIAHINTYGSHHTESILTQTKKHADQFAREVDSACCFVNISTRFSDGHQFGLGAEIGISTDKLHARGPMGLEELTTYKYIVHGNGQIRT